MKLNTLFTEAFNLPSSWSVVDFQLDYEHTDITFNLSYDAKTAPCPHCGQNALIHDRKTRQWRHIDFFHFKAYFSAKIPRTKCTSCHKTIQIAVPWARENSGFTLGFEAVCVSLAQLLPMLHVAKILGISDKQVYRQVEYYVDKARELQTYQAVKTIGIDETSTKKGHNYITLVHDLERKQLLFATEGKDNETIKSFLSDFKQRNGEPDKIEHACIDMSPAYIKGVTESLPNAQISFDTFHVVALVEEAMEAVRKSELSPKARKQTPVPIESETIKSLMWGMRKDKAQWNDETTQAMDALKKSKLKSAKAWQMKETFRAICADARKTNDKESIEKKLKSWISWARRCRLEPFKDVAKTLNKHFDGIVRGLMDNRSNAYVEAMNGLLQQAKRAAKGYRNINTFITIAYLRMGKLDHLPQNPMYKPQKST